MATKKLNQINNKKCKSKIFRNTYIHIGSDTLLKEVKAIENDRTNEKPRGGFWSSPYTPNDDYKSEWEEFIATQLPDWDRPNTYMLFKLDDDANILKLVNKYDINFCREQGFVLEDDYVVRLDFELIASKGYDGVYYEFNDYLQYLVRGWDCTSLVLFDTDKVKLI